MRALSLALLGLAVATQAHAQDAEAGARVFVQCKSCHQVGDTAKNLIGPQLNGLFGRKAGAVPGYKYSEVNAGSETVWNDANFTTYIHDPKAAMPGTKMQFAGLKSDKQIADLAAYLHQFKPDGTKTP